MKDTIALPTLTYTSAREARMRAAAEEALSEHPQPDALFPLISALIDHKTEHWDAVRFVIGMPIVHGARDRVDVVFLLLFPEYREEFEAYLADGAHLSAVSTPEERERCQRLMLCFFALAHDLQSSHYPDRPRIDVQEFIGACKGALAAQDLTVHLTDRSAKA